MSHEPLGVGVPNWLFALVVLGFGLCLAYLVDRMRARSDERARENPSTDTKKNRSKWLTFWYEGRFPSRDGLAEEEKGEGRSAKPRRKKETD
jgi:hypothetical protein